MNIHIKVALGIFFTSIALAFIYFFYLHNTFYIDGTVKNTGRLLLSNNNGSINNTEQRKRYSPFQYVFISIGLYRTKLWLQDIIN